MHALLATALGCGWSPEVFARNEPRFQIDLSAATLPEALAELSREAGASIGAAGSLPRLPVRPLHARLSVSEALARLLAGSGYVANQVGERAWRIERHVEAPLRPPPPAVSPAPAPATVAPELVVTATKRDLPLESVPLAAAVRQLDQVREHQPQSGSGLIAQSIEGLSVTGEGPGRNRMFVRGVADSAFGGRTQSTVAVLLDDSRVTYEAPDPDIRLVDVERVELLKGPQGSLYGTGALGGVYRVVTNRANVTNASVSGSLTAEQLATGRRGGGGTLIINLPIARHVAGLRLVGYAEDAPGWINTGERRGSNSSSTLGARAGLGVESGPWRIDVTGLVQALNSRDSSYVYRPDRRSRPEQFAEPHDNDLLHGSLRLERQGAVTLVLSSGLTRHSVNDTYDATQGVAGLGVADPRVLQDDSTFTVWDSEARLTGRTGVIAWLAGISHIEARHAANVALEGATERVALETARQLSIESALFGEATAPVAEHLDLTFGARVSRSSLEVERVKRSEASDLNLTRSAFTPSAALAFTPRRGRLFYARYGSAFRQGGVSVDTAGRSQPLEGDELATVEAGGREQRGGLSFDLGLYHSWWRDVQSDRLAAGGLVETTTAGDAAISGAELTVTGSIADRWFLEAGATLQSAMLVSDPNGLDLDDRRLPVVPKWTLRASARRTWSIGPWDIAATGRLRYVGSERLSFDPALDRPMGRTLDSALELRAQQDRWTASVELSNLFGGAEDTFAYGNPLRLPAGPQFIPQEPFSARLTLVFRP